MQINKQMEIKRKFLQFIQNIHCRFIAKISNTYKIRKSVSAGLSRAERRINITVA